MQKRYGSHQNFFIGTSCRLLLLFLFTAQTAAAQVALQAAAQRAASHPENAVAEKMFVHTDKNFYLAGELLWFKLYNLQAATHLPSIESKIAYIELLDQNNKPLVQHKVAVDSGEASGSMQLPLAMETGTYSLRAYTSWMKNDGASRFFQKDIPVVNTLKVGDLNLKDTAAAFALAFFPEGGNLVAGLQNKLAFKATDASGKGMALGGVVLSDKGDTLTFFATAHRGMGSFVFTPEDQHTYHAVITLPDGTVVRRPLPKAAASGYAVRVEMEESQKLKITVDKKGMGADGATVYLAATNLEQVKAAAQASFSNNQAVFYIDATTLGPGINRITLFDGSKQPIGERLYFKRPERIMQIEAASDAADYNSRQKVTIGMTAKNETGAPLQASLSMAVYLADSFQQWDAQSIDSYLWLQSDLKGTVEAPEYYLHDSSPEAVAAADLLMLTHGWRRFANSEPMKSKVPFQYPVEYDGHVVKGIVRNLLSGEPAAGIQTFLSVPGSNLQFYTSRSDNNGLVQFNVKNYYGAGVIVVQTNTEKDSLYQVQILSPFAESFEPVAAKPLRLPLQLEGSLLNNSIGMQVQNVYHVDSLLRFSQPQTDSLPFYGTATNSYLLDDYVRFTTMEEVLREYVREINVRKRGGQYQMILYNEPEQLFFRDDALIMVDGVPLFNQTGLFAYDPLKVRRLDVVTRRYFLGQLSFNGIASFTTHAGNFEGLALNPRAVIIDYEGLQQQREFYAPVYETEQQLLSRMPDFRNLLHWAPNVKYAGGEKEELSFYTSDRKGKYIVVVQGISRDGRAGTTTITVDVK